MKKFRYIVCCVVLSAFTACIAEDTGDCPPPTNVTLTFSYTGDTGDSSMFRKMISHVTLQIFDSNGGNVFEQLIPEKELRKFQGTQLFLEPGNYKAVCWGNANEHTEIKDPEHFETERVHHPGFITGKEIETNSHLYFGTYNLSVPAGYTECGGDISFRGAHINMEVYIRTDKHHSSGCAVRVQNLMPQYDITMSPAQPFATTYYPQIGYDTEREVDESLFQVFRFSDNNPVIVEVIQPTGGRIYVDMKDYMLKNNITVEGKNEVTVPILLELNDLGVVIKVPEWIPTDVTPGT